MAEKDADFDPYHKWLGIPREQRPVTFYQLLGISPSETDIEVIEDAATRQSSHVRTYQLGAHADVCQRVLNEIAQAKTSLLNPEKRKVYDAQIGKAARPKSQPAAPRPAAERPAERAPARPQARKPNTTMIVGIAAVGVAAVAALIGGGVWLSSSPSTPGPTVRKNEPKVDHQKPVIVAEKKAKTPEPPKGTDSPKPVEPKKGDPPVVAKNGGDLKIEMRLWHNDMPKIAKLMHKSDGFVVHGGWKGSFNGPGEYVKIVSDEQDDWILDGQAVPQLEGWVYCVSGLPKGWFDLERATDATWGQGAREPMKPPVELLSENEGICWLAGVSGDLSGGEGVRVYREEGKWLLGGASGGSEISGRAIVARFGKGVDRTKLRISEVAWRPADGPIKLLDVKDGFCALTEVFGKFKAPKQQVKLSMKNGAWWIDGNDTQGNLRAKVLRVSLTGNLPPLPTESTDPNPQVAKKDADVLKVELRQWRNGAPNVTTLMRKTDGIALFGGATGSFNGGGEIVAVEFAKGDDWTLRGGAAPQLEGYVNCVTGLPSGWFDLPSAKEIGWKIGDGDAMGRVELLAENDGICWLAGITGSFGGGEGMRVVRADGKWMLHGATAGGFVAGRAIAIPFGKGVDRTRLRISELPWQPKDGPIKLLDLKDGFCALTEIHGKFQSHTQQVKLSVKDGAWWIEGNDTQGNLRARVLRVSLTGNLPTIPGAEAPHLIKGGKSDSPKTLQATWPMKQPMPEVAVLAAKEKEIHALLPSPGPKAAADQIARHAKALLDVGLETKDDVPLRFAAIREAFELAFPLGDSDIADRALQALALDYVVEPAALKATALIRAATKTTDPAAFRSLADSIDEFVDDAIAADDLERAEKVCAIGLVGAQKTKDAALTSAAVKRLSQCRAVAKSHQSCKSAQEVLAKTPDDPKACLEVGRYLALVKGDWDAGLKLLAKGSDAKLKALAQKDLDGPADIDARAALGDGWADFAQHDSGIHKANAATRARRWYAMIVGEAPVLKRIQIEKHMGEVEKLIPMRGPQPAARWTFDIDARDVVGTMHGTIMGNPKFADGQMHMIGGDYSRS